MAAGALIALVWANSPWSAGYESLVDTAVAVSIGGHGLDLDLRHWVNDGLMTVFFLVVGLEIKREVVDGHLSTRRAAMLPMLAALGGMVVPALVYLMIAGGTATRGWAIPIATDIALAIGVLAVVGSRLPPSLRAFLLGLAIVDDIGAIVIIAAFYSSGIDWAWLVVGVAAFGLAASARALRVHAVGLYFAVGAGLWFALHEAGIHPTLAGVALGLLAPSVPRFSADYIDADELADVSSVEKAGETAKLAHGSVSVVEWLQHVLHPWTGYVIVPIFALANSGIEISGDALSNALSSRVAWGVFAGLVLGKPLGVMASTALSIRTGIAEQPAGASGGLRLGVGAAAGIGFTVALFITELAFTDPARQAEAKVAILAASVVAAAMAAAILRAASPTDAFAE